MDTRLLDDEENNVDRLGKTARKMAGNAIITDQQYSADAKQEENQSTTQKKNPKKPNKQKQPKWESSHHPASMARGHLSLTKIKATSAAQLCFSEEMKIIVCE